MQLVTWLRSLASRSHRPQPNRTRPSLETLEERSVPSVTPHDILYISDGGDNSVKRFDASSGAYLGNEVAPGAGGLDGPRGLIFRNPAKLLVANQNVDQNFNGEILRYNSQTGASLGALVPSADPNAPFAPRGMVLADNVLYVADFQGATAPDGRIARYNANNGKFLGNLTPTNFPGQFNPRGVVFGPDGDLYVSSFDTSNTQVGYVVRFDPTHGTSTIVAANNGDGIDQPGEIKDLHRPEGLTFGPDGQLYVTSFRANASDTDKILILNGKSGALNGEINLDQVSQPRAFAQALEFGPNGRLFVPITGNGPDTGAVRSYDVIAKTYITFVAPGTLGQPWYLTFGRTDPATLAYTGSSAQVSDSDSDNHNQAMEALAQPFSTLTASTVPTTLPAGPQTESVAPAPSSSLSVAATPTSVTPPAARALHTGANDLLFTAWADDLFTDRLRR